jgi:zinc protease
VRRFARSLGLALVASGLGGCGATPRLVPPLRYAADPIAPDDPARATPPSPAPVAEAVDAPPRSTTLPNGMRVVLYERHDYPTFAARLVIDRGAVDLDDEGATQLSQMMYLFATEPDVDRWSRHETDTSTAATRYGSGASASQAWLSAEGTDGGFDGAIAALARWCMSGALTQDEYDRRAAEWADITRKKVVSLDHGVELVLWGRSHPYGYAGRPEAILPLGAARSLHGHLFQPAHAALVVVGDIDPSRLDEAASRAFGAWTDGAPIGRRTAAPPPDDGPHLSVIPDSGLTQTWAHVAALGPSPSSDDVPAFLVVGKLLAGGKSSRLFERLRDETGDAYLADFGVHFERTASIVTMKASYDTDKAVEGVGDVLRAIADLRGGKVTDEELAVAREAVLADWRSTMASHEGAASAYAFWLGLGAGAERQRTLPTFVEGVRREDVARVASRYLDRRGLHVVFLGEARWLDASPLHLGNLQRISLD